MGRRVRDASNVVLTMALDMISCIIDAKVAEKLSRHPKNKEASAENRMRQLTVAEFVTVLRFSRGTSHLFFWEFGLFAKFAKFASWQINAVPLQPPT